VIVGARPGMSAPGTDCPFAPTQRFFGFPGLNRRASCLWRSAEVDPSPTPVSGHCSAREAPAGAGVGLAGKPLASASGLDIAKALAHALAAPALPAPEPIVVEALKGEVGATRRDPYEKVAGTTSLEALQIGPSGSSPIMYG
jgi:hypothetical protein